MDNDQSNPTNEVMNGDEAATFLKMPKSTLLKLCSEGQLPGLKVGRNWRFNRTALEKWKSDKAGSEVDFTEESEVVGEPTPMDFADNLTDAEASVGFSFLKERFSTWVRHDRAAPRVEVGLIRGPFRHLRNVWDFHAVPEGTRLEFLIDFAFRSPLLDAMLQANFDRAVGSLIRRFEARAAELYGKG